MLSMIFLISLTASAVLGLLAVRYGTDTRPVFDERPESPGLPHRAI